VFTGWLALFSGQAMFAANGRLRWHLRLGRIGIAYGVLLVIVGLTTGVLRSAALPRGGQAEGLLYVAFVDMHNSSSPAEEPRRNDPNCNRMPSSVVDRRKAPWRILGEKTT